MVYLLSEQLPGHEAFNLTSQFRRAATSVALNIAEGSTGQSDAEQARFLGLELRSLIESVACQHMINRRRYLGEQELLRQAYLQSEALARKIQAMRRTIAPFRTRVSEEETSYVPEE